MRPPVDPQRIFGDDAAEEYEDVLVPAIFDGWARRLAAAVAPLAGLTVLDACCGTGAVTRALYAHAPDRLIALDAVPAMLDVARRRSPAGIDWTTGSLEALPLPAGSIDVVTCGFGLMFCPDVATAFTELGRVLVPGGRLGLTTWGSLEQSTGYLALVAALEGLGGPHATATLRTVFGLADRSLLRSEATAAGFVDVDARTETGTARFASVEAFAGLYASGLGGGPAAAAALVERIRGPLEPWSSGLGLAFPVAVNVVLGRSGDHG